MLRPTRSGIRSSRWIATCARGRTSWSNSRRASSFRLSRSADGTRKFADYRDFIVNYEKFPGIGFLAGWRGENGESPLRGKPNPKQWEKYIENQSFFTYPWPENMRYYRFANKDYLEFAEKHALFGTPPVQVVLQMYSEPLQKFRLAGQRLYDGPQPASLVDCERLATYFDPLPFWYAPLEGAHRQPAQADAAARSVADDYPLHAITQRPMMMYHSWDAQNAWLRQIIAENRLYMNRGTARGLGSDATTTGSGSNRITAGSAASSGPWKVARPIRSGPGTPSASRRAPGA